MTRLRALALLLALAGLACASSSKPPKRDSGPSCPRIASATTTGLAVLPFDVSQHATAAMQIEVSGPFCSGAAALVKERLTAALLEDGWDLCAFALDEIPRPGAAEPPDIDLRVQLELQPRADGADRCAN